MIRTWIRGLRLLRNQALVNELGRRQQQLLEIEGLRAHCPKARISSEVRLSNYAPGRISIGDGAIVSEGTILSCGGEEYGFGTIEIGPMAYLGQYNNLRAGGGPIRIGHGCLISQFCTITASNHDMSRNRPMVLPGIQPGRLGVVLEDDVWLGAGASVMPGVRIGKGAVIGANAVVTRDVPEYEIWAGIPARPIGVRE